MNNFEMPPAMLKRYLALDEPLEMDEEIRGYFNIPQRYFYSVSMNKETIGRVIVDKTRERIVHAVKLSKSP